MRTADDVNSLRGVLDQSNARRLLDAIDRLRWDHVWIYSLIADCRRVAALQKQAREETRG